MPKDGAPDGADDKSADEVQDDQSTSEADESVTDGSTDDAKADDKPSGTRTPRKVDTGKRPTGKKARKPAAAEDDGFESVPDDFDPDDSDKDDSRKPGKVDTKSARGKQVTFTINTAGVLKVVAGLVVLTVLVLLSIGTWGWFDERENNDNRSAAVKAAEKYTTEVTDTKRADTLFDRVLPLTTGKLKESMSQQNKDPQETVKQIQALELNVRTSVWSSAVESVGESKATVVVLLKFAGTSATTATRTEQLMIFRLMLDKQGGKWLVSNAENGPTPSDSGGSTSEPDPSAPTSGAPQPNVPITQAPPPS